MNRLLSLWLNRIWYRPRWYDWLFIISLLPLSLIYCLLAAWHKKVQSAARRRPPLPVIVVGNITVGGSGKTPFVIYLVQKLQQQGFQPGVISRGYGGVSRQVTLVDSLDCGRFGDEPVLIKKHTRVPVCVGADRNAALEILHRGGHCDIVVSDDGLQHHRMGRTVEIALMDGTRGLGNGICLPAGPLRERRGRLQRVDFHFVLQTGSQPGENGFCLQAHAFVNLASGQRLPLESFKGRCVAAVAGIAHPGRFFRQLRALGLQVTEIPFSDHHVFTAGDFANIADPVIMTEKDAVKCMSFAGPDHWYLEVAVQMQEHWLQALLEKIKSHNINGSHTP